MEWNGPRHAKDIVGQHAVASSNDTNNCAGESVRQRREEEKCTLHHPAITKSEGAPEANKESRQLIYEFSKT